MAIALHEKVQHANVVETERREVNRNGGAPNPAQESAGLRGLARTTQTHENETHTETTRQRWTQ